MMAWNVSMRHPVSTRHPVDALSAFVRELLGAAGMETDKAEVTAELLVEADLLGHDTHGLSGAPHVIMPRRE